MVYFARRRCNEVFIDLTEEHAEGQMVVKKTNATLVSRESFTFGA